MEARHLTREEMMRLCAERARRIVASYRAEAPEGYDPQCSMAVIAVVGIGATVASAGVQMYSANKAGKAAKSAAGQAASQFQATGQKADSLLKKYQRLLADPSRVLSLTQNANNQNWEGARDQATRLNNFNQGELSRMVDKAIPGYQNLIGRALKNTRSWIRGEVPNDVASFIEDRAAEHATRFGLPAGSAAARAITSRDLGRTSLDLMSQGENSLQRWISTAKNSLTPSLSSPMDFLFTPQQYTNTVLAGANIASQRAGILTGAGNNATNAYLQGEQAKISADQAQMQALAQGLESIGGIGMAYAGAKGGLGAGGAAPAWRTNASGGTMAGSSNPSATLAALGLTGGTQGYLNAV